MEYAIINWLDAQKHPEIPAMHAAKIAPIEAITVGVVMEKNDDYITIAQTIFEETETSPSQTQHLISIPKPWITECQTLALPNGKGNELLAH